MPLRWHEPKTNLDVNERRMPIAKFAERIPAPETGSVIVRLTNVVFVVIARVIDAPTGTPHRLSVLAERVIVPLKVVRLLLAKLMVASDPSVFFPSKVAKGGLPHLSD